MTLPNGQIHMSQVNTELGRSSTATITLNDSAVRALAEKPSGQIAMWDLRGKSAFAPNNGGFFEDYTWGPVTPDLIFQSNGNVEGNGQADLGNWGSPITTGIGSSYDIYVYSTGGNGTMGGAALNAWHNMGSNVGFWMASGTYPSVKTKSLSWSMRRASDQVEIAWGTAYLECDNSA